MFPDINPGQINNDKDYNFLNKYDKKKYMFSTNCQMCDYFVRMF